jgi:hypothetical protein
MEALFPGPPFPRPPYQEQKQFLLGQVGMVEPEIFQRIEGEMFAPPGWGKFPFPLSMG